MFYWSSKNLSTEIKAEDLEIRESYEIYVPYNSTTEWLDDLLNKDCKFKTIEETNNLDANFIISRKGRTILQYKDHTYRRIYRNKIGIRWICSKNKNCNAYIYTDDDNKILDACEDHFHEQHIIRHQDVDSDKKGKFCTVTAIFVINNFVGFEAEPRKYCNSMGFRSSLLKSTPNEFNFLFMYLKVPTFK